MNDDDAKVLDRLRKASETAGVYLSRHTVKYIDDAVALIERLLAENAALRSEAERLTPLADAMDTVDAMNKHKVNGMTWRIGTPSLVGNGVNGINGTPESACYSLAAGKHRVHQIEDRDAGPIAAQEPAKGEDDA